MTSAELRERLRNEIGEIPDLRLQEVFDLVHHFRPGLDPAPPAQASEIMGFAGAWASMDDFDGFLDELRERRYNAFKSRRQDETSAD